MIFFPLDLQFRVHNNLFFEGSYIIFIQSIIYVYNFKYISTEHFYLIKLLLMRI